MEDMSQFVYTTVIPKLIEDLSNLSTTPIDGIALTDIMHTRGINMRYLGKIAHMCKKRKNLDYVYVSFSEISFYRTNHFPLVFGTQERTHEIIKNKVLRGEEFPR